MLSLLLLTLALIGNGHSLNPFRRFSETIWSSSESCSQYEIEIRDAVHHVGWYNLTLNEPHILEIQRLCAEAKDCFENNQEMKSVCEAWSPVNAEWMICFRKVGLSPEFANKCPKPKDFNPADCKQMFPVIDCAKEEMRKGCAPSVIEHWDEVIAFVKSLPGCS